QNIQLQKVVVNRMIIKMGGHDIRRRIVGRMLHRGKGVDLFSQGQNNDSARMLSGTPADSWTPLNDPVDLAVSFSLSPLFIIILYISECGFICQGSNGPGSIGLSGSEDDLRVFMCVTLVISREVQVNI